MRPCVRNRPLLSSLLIATSFIGPLSMLHGHVEAAPSTAPASVTAPSPGTASARAAEKNLVVLGRLQERAKVWRKALPEIRKSAARAAGGTIGGGHLYIAGPQQSFVEEALGRSGGLLLAQGYSAETTLTPNDTVLAAYPGAACLSPNADGTAPARKFISELVAKANAAGAAVVLFGTDSMPELAVNAQNLQRLPGKASATALGRELSIESVSNVIGLWAWTGEFAAACVERGKMPAFYESIGMPGGRERDNGLRGVAFHPTTSVTPAEIRGLGGRYLDVLAAALGATRTQNAAAFVRAADLIRTARASGGVVKTFYLGHMFPAEIRVVQNPQAFTVGIMTPLPAGIISMDAPKIPEDILGSNDIGIILGYQSFPTPLVAAAPSNRWIVTASHRPLSDFSDDPRRVYLNPFWSAQDAVGVVPNYDIDILPISGVMQSAIYWQLVELSGEK